MDRIDPSRRSKSGQCLFGLFSVGRRGTMGLLFHDRVSYFLTAVVSRRFYLLVEEAVQAFGRRRCLLIEETDSRFAVAYGGFRSCRPRLIK